MRRNALLGLLGTLLIASSFVLGQTNPSNQAPPLPIISRYATNSTPGYAQCDGTTTTCAANGVISATGGGTAGPTLQATKTGTVNYTIAAGDANTIIPVNTDQAPTITINSPSAGYFPIGSPGSVVFINDAYIGTSLNNPNMTIKIGTGAAVFVDVPVDASGNFYLVPQQVAMIMTNAAGNYHVQIYGSLPGENYIPGTSYTFSVYDCYQTDIFNSATAVAITMPVTGTLLPANCIINIIQNGAGLLGFAQATSSGPIYSLSNQAHSAGQNAGMTLTVLRGAVTANLSGSLAP
jgi:hypothetical protein